VWMDGVPLELAIDGASAVIPRSTLLQGNQPVTHIDVHLEIKK